MSKGAQFRPAFVAGVASAKASWQELPVTATLARPVAAVFAGAWLPSSGSSLPDMINESSPDDGTYIYTVVQNTTRQELSPAALVEGGTRALKVRSWTPSNNGGLIARLYQGATLIATRSYSPLPTGATTHVVVLTTGEAAALTSGLNLFVELEATA